MNGSRAELETEALYEISRVLSLSTDLNKAFTSTLTLIDLVLGLENGTISLFDPVTGEVFVEAAPHMRDEDRILGRLRPGEGIVGRIFATGMPMVVPDIAEEPLFLNRTGTWQNLEEDRRAFVGVPLQDGRAVLGVLTADRPYRTGPTQLGRDVRFLTIVAGLVAVRVRLSHLENTHHRAAQDVPALSPSPERFPGIVGASAPFRDMLELIGRVAQSRATVLLRGESGTGKELIARAVHDASPRAERPFVTVNCAAIPETLLESELFGHEKGSFTGAAQAHVGRFEQADGGTLFLDEVGELSPAAQAKLLRAVQERQFERVGGKRTVTVDVRLVAATNRDMEEMVRQGAFRLDLYHRLSVVAVVVPPLRERRDDIPRLAGHFLRVLNEENARSAELTPAALEVLTRCRWTGNVRQLRNCLERLVVVTDADVLAPVHLPCQWPGGSTCLLERAAPPPEAELARLAERAPPATAAGPLLAAEGEAGERERVRAALERAGYVQAKAARLLGMTVRQLGYRVRKYGIELQRL
ncbi:nif-specific transcriptional activator NifA [Anaeromyxobacter diazotrophicus]|uniref:Nif-specific regulatory protein n=1 Tax=Anaeromyxobacter diazotrophicus TaxID=2590199 RepID=A0A7I9VR97_9BACT|nr:nif-specific transcriptional activator NifA [Anaeromyxobacter diazotrophicus]GEJ58935.1 sigma-54-dependent Fis family transcriptional regulator [Anaeromyxobacter diazotrophicus]